MMDEELRKKAELHLLEKISKARAWLDTKAIYVATTYEAFIVHFVPGIKTMGVTRGYVLYVDPIWLLSDPDINGPEGHEYLGADLLHECGHVLRDLDRLEAVAKWFQSKGFDKKKANEWANIAGDMPINQDILSMKLKMHKWVITPDTYGFKPGLTMEGYAKLMLENQQMVEQKNSEGQEGEGEGQACKGKGKSKDKGKGTGKGDSSSGGGQSRRIGGGCCGGIAGNPNEEIEKGLDNTIGRDEYDQERIKYETAESIREYQEANGKGSTPGFIEEILPKKRKEKPPVDWKKELRYVVRRTTGNTVRGGSDYSLRRPSKRSMMLGVIRPGLIDQQPTVHVIVDSSGSMGTKQLQDAGDLTISVLEQLGIDQLWFQYADTQTHGPPKIISIKDVPKLNPQGRGGTSFIQPIQEALKLRPKPDILIYITDGDGDAPAVRPKNLSVIWCIVPTGCGRKPANWGHLVVCSNDQKLREPYNK